MEENINKEFTVDDTGVVTYHGKDSKEVNIEFNSIELTKKAELLKEFEKLIEACMKEESNKSTESERARLFFRIGISKLVAKQMCDKACEIFNS